MFSVDRLDAYCDVAGLPRRSAYRRSSVSAASPLSTSLPSSSCMRLLAPAEGSLCQKIELCPVTSKALQILDGMNQVEGRLRASFRNFCRSYNCCCIDGNESSVDGTNNNNNNNDDDDKSYHHQSWSEKTAPAIVSFLASTTGHIESLSASLSSLPQQSARFQHLKCVCSFLMMRLDRVNSMFKEVDRAVKGFRGDGIVRYAGRYAAGPGAKEGKYETLRKRDVLKGLLLLNTDKQMLFDEGKEIEQWERDEEEDLLTKCMGRSKFDKRDAAGQDEGGGGDEDIVFGRERRDDEVDPCTSGNDKGNESVTANAVSKGVMKKYELSQSEKTASRSEERLPFKEGFEEGGVLHVDREDFSTSLLLENSLLSTSLQSNLDSVEVMESTMTSITNLLSSFTTLVETQSEQICGIENLLEEAKTAVVKGSEQLQTAKETTDSATYTVPAIILIMALTLLFVNSYTP